MTCFEVGAADLQILLKEGDTFRLLDSVTETTGGKWHDRTTLLPAGQGEQQVVPRQTESTRVIALLPRPWDTRRSRRRGHLLHPNQVFPHLGLVGYQEHPQRNSTKAHFQAETCS